MLTVQCEGCEKRFRVSERFGGRRMRCRQCGRELDVPVAAASAEGGALDSPHGGAKENDRRNKDLEETAILERRSGAESRAGSGVAPDVGTEVKAAAGEDAASGRKTGRGGRRVPSLAGRKGRQGPAGGGGRRGIGAGGRSRRSRERGTRAAAASSAGKGRSLLYAGVGLAMVAVAIVVWAVFFPGGDGDGGESLAGGDIDTPAAGPGPGSANGGRESRAAEGTAGGEPEAVAEDLGTSEEANPLDSLLPPAPESVVDLIPADAGLIVSADIDRLKALGETFGIGGEEGAGQMPPQASMLAAQGEMLRHQTDGLKDMVKDMGLDPDSVRKVSVALSFPPLADVLGSVTGDGGMGMEIDAGFLGLLASFLEENVLLIVEGDLRRRELADAGVISEEEPRPIGPLTAYALPEDMASPASAATPAFPEDPGGPPDPLRDAADAAVEGGGFEFGTATDGAAQPAASGGGGPTFYAAFFEGGVAVVGGEPSLEKVAAILEGRGRSSREDERLAALAGGFEKVEPVWLAVNLPADYSRWLHEQAKGNPQLQGQLRMFSIEEPPRIEGLFLALGGTPDGGLSARLGIRCAREQEALDIQKVAAGFSAMGFFPIPLRGGVSGSTVEFNVDLSMEALQAMMAPAPPPDPGVGGFDLPEGDFPGGLPGGFGDLPGAGPGNDGRPGEPGDGSLEELGDDLSLPGEDAGAEAEREPEDLEELDLEDLDLDAIDLDLEDGSGSEEGS